MPVFSWPPVAWPASHGYSDRAVCTLKHTAKATAAYRGGTAVETLFPLKLVVPLGGHLRVSSTPLFPQLCWCPCLAKGSRMAQMAKNLPEMWETRVTSLGQKDPLEKGMVTHSSIFAWRIPRTEAPGGLQSRGSPESDTTVQITLRLMWFGKSENQSGRKKTNLQAGSYVLQCLCTPATLVLFPFPETLSLLSIPRHPAFCPYTGFSGKDLLFVIYNWTQV